MPYPHAKRINAMNYQEIDVTFKDGTQATYTTNIISLLVESGECEEITSHENGEIIWNHIYGYIEA